MHIICMHFYIAIHEDTILCIIIYFAAVAPDVQTTLYIHSEKV
jgi:hypothetical protein